MNETNLESKVEKLAKEWQGSLVNPEWTEQMLFMNFMAYCLKPAGYSTGESIYGGAVAKPEPEKHIKAYKTYLLGEMDGLGNGAPEKNYYASALKKISSTFPELD